MVRAESLSDMGDDCLAAIRVDVDVDIRHRHTLGIEETLKQKTVLSRLQLGNTEAIGDAAADGAAATGSDTDAVLLCEGNDIEHDEEIVDEAHLFDDSHLHFQSRQVLLPPVAIAALQAGGAERAEILLV